MAEQVATWRDQMQRASFRGVAFSVLSTDGNIGRRNAIHEYPLRDRPFAEDLGRKAREFSLEAFVLGADYMAARDKLIAALEQAGSGELVHPYRGRVQVVVTNARVAESTAEGGMATFSLTFTESGENLNPATKTDNRAAVLSAADGAQAASESSFFDAFTIDGLQDFVGTEALSTINDALNSMRLAANSGLSNALMPEFTQQLFGIANSASSLMRFPANLAGGLFNQVRSLSGIASSPLDALSSLRSLFSFGSDYPTVSTATPARRQQAVNQSAVVNLTRQAAVIEAVRVSTQINPASFSDALVLRDELTEQLELHADTAPDLLYSALTGLRIAMIKDLTARAADLSRTVQYPVPTTLPALVIAHRLYGAVDQADNLVARNKIHHPGFVPGGRSIEVLTP